MAKSKPVSNKAIPSSIIPVPAGNLMGVVCDVNQDEIRRAYRQLVGQFHLRVGKAPDADIGFKEREVMGDE